VFDPVKTVTRIDEDIFGEFDNVGFGNETVKRIYVPDTVKYIDPQAFIAANALKTIDIDSANKTYSSANGMICTKKGLFLFFIPKGVTGCIDLRMYPSVKRFGTVAFFNCRKLETVYISNQITAFGRLSFDSCDSLSDIYIPDSVKKIYHNAFQRWGARSCPKLTIHTPIGSRAEKYARKHKIPVITYTAPKWTSLMESKAN